MIQYYNTEAEYQAAVKSSFESQISLIGASNEIHYDGINVVVGINSAVTGSVVVLDGNSAMHFIYADTFSSASFMSNYTIIGVVAVGIDHPDFRGKIVIVHKNNASKKFSEIYSFKITGYTLDGTDRTGILSIRTSDAWGTAKDFTVSYNASTVQEFLTQLNTYFSADAQYTPAGGSAMDNPFKTQNWVATADADDNITLAFLFSDYRQASNAGKTGFALTANLMPGITASTAMLRVNGQRSGEGTITNWDRAIRYFSDDLNNATYNPTTTQTAANAKRNYPICKPGYLGTSQYSGGEDRCAAIRAIYGDGEAGWLKFMATFLPVRPTTYGPLSGSLPYGDGKRNTYLLVGTKFTKQDGTEIDAFPAAEYAAAPIFNHELLKKGCWHMPDMDTVFAIMKTIHYNTTNNRNADPTNKALYAIGGNAISNGSSIWSCSRSSAYGMWLSGGGNGYANNNAMTTTFLSLPVVLLDVPLAQ